MAPGTVIADKYRLVRLLGEGAMGAVWEAENLATGRSFAVKIMARQVAETPEMHERLLREARATGRISHRNVVGMFDVGRTPTGEPFLVMELLRGQPLDQYLDQRGALPADEVVAIATEVARGLSAAHALGIIHRDLKPANIFLHQDPDLGVVVKVVDFGVSKDVDASTGTISGVAIGSPAYMSPEQARGERGLDTRSDIWALGVVIFELSTGRRPFDGDTAYDVVAEILKGAIPRVRDVAPGADPRIDQVVAACLQRDRDARIATAEGVLMALGAPARATVPSGPQISPARAANKPTTTVGQSIDIARAGQATRALRVKVTAFGGATALVIAAAFAFVSPPKGCGPETSNGGAAGGVAHSGAGGAGGTGGANGGGAAGASGGAGGGGDAETGGGGAGVGKAGGAGGRGGGAAGRGGGAAGRGGGAAGRGGRGGGPVPPCPPGCAKGPGGLCWAGKLPCLARRAVGHRFNVDFEAPDGRSNRAGRAGLEC